MPKGSILSDLAWENPISILHSILKMLLKKQLMTIGAIIPRLPDFVVGVKAPLILRLQRAMKRDNISREEAMARINQQMDEEKKIRLCNFVITNDEDKLVIPQVLALHNKFLKM